MLPTGSSAQDLFTKDPSDGCFELSVVTMAGEEFDKLVVVDWIGGCDVVEEV